MRSTVPVLVCLCVPVPSPSVFLPAMLKRSVVRPYRYARPHECRRAGNRCGRASGCESRFCPSLRGLAKQSRCPFPRSDEVIRNDMETLLIPGLLRRRLLAKTKRVFFGFLLPARSLSSLPVCLCEDFSENPWQSSPRSRLCSRSVFARPCEAIQVSVPSFLRGHTK